MLLKVWLPRGGVWAWQMYGYWQKTYNWRPRQQNMEKKKKKQFYCSPLFPKAKYLHIPCRLRGGSPRALVCPHGPAPWEEVNSPCPPSRAGSWGGLQSKGLTRALKDKKNTGSGHCINPWVNNVQRLCASGQGWGGPNCPEEGARLCCRGKHQPWGLAGQMQRALRVVGAPGGVGRVR